MKESDGDLTSSMSSRVTIRRHKGPSSASRLVSASPPCARRLTSLTPTLDRHTPQEQLSGLRLAASGGRRSAVPHVHSLLPVFLHTTNRTSYRSLTEPWVRGRMQCLSRAPPRPQDKEKRTLSCRGHDFQGQGAVSSVPRRCVQGAVSKALCPRRGPRRCVQSALRCVSSVPQILSADFSIALSSVPQILSADFSIAFSSRSPSSCEGGRRHGRGQTQRKQEEAVVRTCTSSWLATVFFFGAAALAAARTSFVFIWLSFSECQTNSASSFPGVRVPCSTSRATIVALVRCHRGPL